MFGQIFKPFHYYPLIFKDLYNNKLLSYWLQPIWIFIIFILIIHLTIQLASVFGSFHLDGSCKVYHMEFVIILIANTFCFVIMEISQQIVCRMGLGNFCHSILSSAGTSKQRESEILKLSILKVTLEKPCQNLHVKLYYMFTELQRVMIHFL